MAVSSASRPSPCTSSRETPGGGSDERGGGVGVVVMREVVECGW